MSAPVSSPEQLCFHFTSVLTPLGNGSYKVTPGRIVRPVEFVGTREVMRRAGLRKSQAVELAHRLGARQGGKGCLLRVPVAELEQWLERRAADHS